MAGLRITEVSLFPVRIIALPDANPESTARKNRSLLTEIMAHGCMAFAEATGRNVPDECI